jgi:alpha 1,6-mannosyltransferase
MALNLTRWRTLRRRTLSLSPRQRLAAILGLALALVFTGGILYRVLADDERFYNRTSTYFPHDAEALGMASTDWLAEDNQEIPPKLWQIFLPPASQIPEKLQGFAENWRKKNPHHQYELLDNFAASEYVKERFPRNLEIRTIFSRDGSTAIKSDLLRYLLLYHEGGVYTDMDTVPIRPIDDWIPERFQGRARVVVGIEFDRLDGPNWRGVHRDLQFCQWTIMAAPGHPLFGAMLERSMFYLRELLGSHDMSYFPNLQLSTNDVLTTTGPAAWTDAVFQELKLMDPTIQSLRDISGLKEERLIGDILILPVDGFGAGQRHSGSTRGRVPKAARAKHRFAGHWKHK